MPFTAQVYNVMIASPGDVAVERGIVRDVISEWNGVNSQRRSLILQPMGWESHSTPEMGDRPQALINKQILKGADLLVAIFWTRLGTPTGHAPSGTVEEIEEHVAAGRPAMIYFSSAPVRPDSVDEEQYKALKAFRAECEKKGLIEVFDSATDFRIKFARQLAAKINSHDYFVSQPEPNQVTLDFGSFVEAKPEIPNLSAEATGLLIEASQDSSGRGAYLRYIGGEAIQTNGKQFIESGNPRSRAAWQNALKQLEDFDLLTGIGYKGEMFEITQRGYEVAALLQK